MSNKLLTQDEVDRLRANTFVKSVNCRSVSFTPEFKRIVHDKLLSGKPIRDIFEDHGIDTAALGEARINGFLARIREIADREEGFQDLRHQRRSKTPEERNLTAEKRIRQLEAELAYTRQEVEFLKKVQAADMEARKAWESKHRPK